MRCCTFGQVKMKRVRDFGLFSAFSLFCACQPPAASEPDPQEEAPSIEGNSDAADSASEQTQDSPKSPKPLPEETLPDDNPGPKEGAEPPNCDIDFLFVVDNSQSMATKQTNLAASVPKFVETLVDELEHEVDYHLGVITTDAYQGNAENCRKYGALVTSTAGRESSDQACGPYGDGRAFMTRKDPVQENFPCAAKPGIDGDGVERVIDSLRGALNPEIQKAGGCNEGFLRKDAILVTVVISDEDDGALGGGLNGVLGSKGDPSAWHKEVMATKANDEKRMVMLGLLGQPAPNLCSKNSTFSQDAKRLREFVGYFKQNIVADVCAENYDPFFDKAIAMLNLACEEIAPPR